MRRNRGLVQGGRLAVITVLVLVSLLIAPSLTAAQATPALNNHALAGAVSWLQSHQNEDGGFGKPGQSDPGSTADAIVALAAAQHAGLKVELAPAVKYLEQHALVYAQTGPGQAAKLVLAMVAANQDPANVAGVSPLAIVEKAASSGSGMIGSGFYDHALGMLALVAAGQSVPARAITLLQDKQIADGSWAFDGSTEIGKGDSNTTALVVQALVAAGRGEDAMVAKAMEYLRTVQAATGAFAYQPANPLVPDANSTALGVQAILATGGDPTSTAWHDAAAALVAFQNPSGALRYNDQQRDDNLYATEQAIPVLAGQRLPIVAVK